MKRTCYLCRKFINTQNKIIMKIHVLHTGEVRVSPYLPFGGDNCNLLKASGMTTPKEEWIWLPVSVYLIEHPKGLILVDTGWHRDMSPEGVYDKKAQINPYCSYRLRNSLFLRWRIFLRWF